MNFGGWGEGRRLPPPGERCRQQSLHLNPFCTPHSGSTAIREFPGFVGSITQCSAPLQDKKRCLSTNCETECGLDVAPFYDELTLPGETTVGVLPVVSRLVVPYCAPLCRPAPLWLQQLTGRIGHICAVLGSITPRGTFCTSCRCRKGMDRCDPLFARR